MDVQGSKRIVDVYFPADIGTPGVKFQPWVHLHGVMLDKWWLEQNAEWQQLVKKWPSPMGGNADASRMNALTGSALTSEGGKADGSGLMKQQGYILLVPQGTGDVTQGQMWNAKFWTCMTSNRCIDKSVDDVAFLSNVITNMPSLLSGVPIKPQSALSGYSNGGMVAQTLLCQRPDVANSLSAVALLGTMLGSDFVAASCQQKLPRSLPLLWAHGVQDPVLPFEAGSSSMGVKATGAEAGTKHWADRMGCPGAGNSPKTVFTDAGAKVNCVNMCGGQQTTAVLCAMADAGHSLWSQPGAGYTAGLALWAFGGFSGSPKPL